MNWINWFNKNLKIVIDLWTLINLPSSYVSYWISTLISIFSYCMTFFFFISKESDRFEMRVSKSWLSFLVNYLFTSGTCIIIIICFSATAYCQKHSLFTSTETKQLHRLQCCLQTFQSHKTFLYYLFLNLQIKEQQPYIL